VLGDLLLASFEVWIVLVQTRNRQIMPEVVLHEVVADSRHTPHTSLLTDNLRKTVLNSLLCDLLVLAFEFVTQVRIFNLFRRFFLC